MARTEPRHSLYVPITGGALVAVGVAWPVLSSGSLWLLDWVTGPHSGVLPTEALGLNGGLTAGVPFSLLINALVAVIGAPGTWLPLLAFFPIAAAGISRLVGGSAWRQLAAATLYCINPFVFNRVYVGHFGLLLGYALLPFATSSALRFFKSGRWWLPAPALWWAVLTGFSPHFAWIYGVVLLVVWLAHRPFRLAVVARLGALCIMFIGLSAYILLPHNVAQLQRTTGTSNLLALYRTAGDPHLGLFPNVAGLYGFWRIGPGPVLPKNEFSGWPFLLLAILLIAGVGAFRLLRGRTTPIPPDDEDANGRRFAAGMLAIGILGYFLALGDQGPTGALFRLAYLHVPFFSIMEEPEKFLMLTALTYSVFFGYGVDQLVGSVERARLDWPTAGAVGLAVILPLAYTPTLFDGLAGQLTPSHLPASWKTADDLMGDGPGLVLFLPWHLYMSFPFTDDRVVLNPAPSSFRRGVISGDNLQAGSIETTSTSARSAYLQTLFTDGPSLDDFGASVAPLGVQYVVLAKTVDWSSYGWLNSQPDLTLTLDSGSLEVWRNDAYSGIGHSNGGGTIRQISPVAYAIGPGAPGQVTIDAAYQKGWELGNQPAKETPQGTIEFAVGSRGGVVRFAPWSTTRLGYVVSGSVLVVMISIVVCDRWWRHRRAEQRSFLNQA